jgi:hypothetical protein
MGNKNDAIICLTSRMRQPEAGQSHSNADEDDQAIVTGIGA